MDNILYEAFKLKTTVKIVRYERANVERYATVIEKATLEIDGRIVGMIDRMVVSNSAIQDILEKRERNKAKKIKTRAKRGK